MSNRTRQGLRGLSKRRKILIWTIVFCLAIALILLAYYFARQLETSGQEPVRGDLTNRFEAKPSLTYNGSNYALKRNITSVLLMGVDKDANAAVTSFRQGGQADFLLLLVIDHDARTVTQLQIDRDTMAEIVTLGVLGNVTGTRLAQICLSHGFGDGKEQSCEYTVQAVENLLSGMDVQFYLSVDLNAIGVLNDALGGVTVTLEDDFTAFDPQMAAGTTLTLNGEQAELFLRYRISVGDGTNASRMRRQQAYMQSAADALRAKSESGGKAIGALYDALSDIMVTNMRRGRLINEADKAYSYDVQPVQTLDGEYMIGQDGFMEFHADEEALIALIVNTFFTPME